MSELKWQPYDPSWLIELAKVQYADEPEFIKALEKCTTCIEEGGNLFYFVDRMEGHFSHNIPLFSPEKGKIVLDILTDGRIGSMEILGLIFDLGPFGGKDKISN